MTEALSGVEAGHPERIVPDETDSGVVALHLKRYVFAAQWSTGARVLDAACGVGYGSHHLAEMARAIIGVDANEAALAYARDRYARPNLTFQRADVAQLPFEDGSFDLVCSFETIEHVTEPERALDEFARVLHTDGRLIVSTPQVKRTNHRPDNPHHLVEFARADFEGLLNRRFRDVEIFGQRRLQSTRHLLAQRLDVLGLRRRFPILRRAAPLVGTAPFAELTLDDIVISQDRLDEAAEFVAVCRGPVRE